MAIGLAIFSAIHAAYIMPQPNRTSRSHGTPCAEVSIRILIATALARSGACGCRYFCPVAALLPAPPELQTVEQYVLWIRTASLTAHDKRIAAMNAILKR